MATFTRSARAEEDLIDIWTFIAQDSLTAADQVLDRIDEVCTRLAEQPRMGRSRNDLADGLRYFITGAYLVLYRVAGGGVQIVRVVHGARDLPSLFP
ncbi:MAG TPA: type II toxin-antitoxin system RelE/ParE family toxin [Caulobacteraceae bacterium]|jgi:toxin ParE1/3/4